MKFEYDLFLSHSSLDKKMVRELCQQLDKQGYKVWLDEWNIDVGDRISKEINSGLELSQFVGVWLSKNAVRSNWVEDEWRTAYERQVSRGTKIVLPFLGEMCTVPSQLEGRKYIKFYTSFEEGMSELLLFLNKESLKTIDRLKKILVEGQVADEYNYAAWKLGDIALKRNNETAMLALWESLSNTKAFQEIIDSCAYTIGRVITESKDKDIIDLGMSFFEKSISIRPINNILIDKFAFAIGTVYLKTLNEDLKEKTFSFIKKNAKSQNKTISKPYKYTLARVTKNNN